MGAGIISIKNPGAKQDRNDPAVSVRRLFLRAQVDAVVEEVEDPVAAIEMLLGGFDGEPDPVHEKEREEDEDCEPEVPLKQSRTVDVGYHGKNHAYAREQPQKPAELMLVSTTVSSMFPI